MTIVRPGSLATEMAPGATSRRCPYLPSTGTSSAGLARASICTSEPVKRPIQLRVVISLLAVLWTLAGCSPPGITVSTGPRETTIAGRFGGEPRGGAGCAWIETSASERIEVAYPNGWRVEFDPLALYDDAGREQAKGGDTLIIDGYYQEVGASICQPQRMFVATDVSVASASPAPASSLSPEPTST